LVFPAEVFGRRKEKMMMRRIVATTTIPFLLSLVLMTVPARAHGNIDPEIRGGLYTEGDGFLGGGLLTGISSTWYFNPNVEVVFADGDYVTVNGDFHKDLNMGEGPAFWLGGDSNLDLGLNLLGGVGAKYGSARPFGQLKYMISDQSQFSMALGLRF
jgi:hypothetical protein